jgi:hypothetical protein
VKHQHPTFFFFFVGVCQNVHTLPSPPLFKKSIYKSGHRGTWL